jgi:hypothetical protein
MVQQKGIYPPTLLTDAVELDDKKFGMQLVFFLSNQDIIKNVRYPRYKGIIQKKSPDM